MTLRLPEQFLEDRYRNFFIEVFENRDSSMNFSVLRGHHGRRNSNKPMKWLDDPQKNISQLYRGLPTQEEHVFDGRLPDTE